MPYTSTFLMLLFFAQLQAQVVKQPLAINYAGLGAYSKNFSDVFSATRNQASLVNLKVPAFGIYAEMRFMLNELSSYSIIMGFPTTSGSFGIAADYFGSSIFNESQVGFIYARKLGSQVDMGVKFNYHRVKMQGYSALSAINFEIGVLFHLTDKLHSGLHIYNPTSSSLGKSGNEKLASVYSFGLGYEASERLFISSEIVKHENLPAGVNAGLQYNLHNQLFVRTGVSSVNSSSNVSVGVNVGFARIDISAAYHAQLGITPGILLLFNLKKPDNE